MCPSNDECVNGNTTVLPQMVCQPPTAPSGPPPGFRIQIPTLKKGQSAHAMGNAINQANELQQVQAQVEAQVLQA